MWLMFTPFYMEQYMGQLTFAMGALSFAFAVMHLRGRALAADGWWWASVVIKHLTVLYVPILVRMQAVPDHRHRGAAVARDDRALSSCSANSGTGDFSHDNFSLTLDPYSREHGSASLLHGLK